MIAIPNMDKPKVCVDCSVNDMVCGLWMEVANIKAHRHKDCPLIEIVECKDCKYWADDMSGNMWCEHAIGGLTEANDFCSYGERRE